MALAPPYTGADVCNLFTQCLNCLLYVANLELPFAPMRSQLR